MTACEQMSSIFQPADPPTTEKQRRTIYKKAQAFLDTEGGGKITVSPGYSRLDFVQEAFMDLAAIMDMDRDYIKGNHKNAPTTTP